MTPLISALLVAILGLIHVMLGTRKSPVIEVARWSRAAFGLGGLVVIAGAVLIYTESMTGLWIYGAGWLIIQGVAIYNGLKAHGKLRWSHHLTRFVIFGGVFALAYAALT